MADKMMRVAGRDEAGLARAIQTDNLGNLKLAMGSVDVKTRSGLLAVGQEETVLGFLSTQPVEILACAVSFLRATDGVVELVIRDKDGIGKETRLLTLNGQTTAAVNPQNLKDYGSVVWDLEKIRFPDTNTENLITLKIAPIMMPYGGYLKIRNTNTIDINVGVQVIYKKWGNF